MLVLGISRGSGKLGGLTPSVAPGTPLSKAKKVNTFRHRISNSCRAGYKTFVRPRYGSKQTVKQAREASRPIKPVFNEDLPSIDRRSKHRGMYFRIFRNERRLLSSIEEHILPRDGQSRKIYRSIRFVYYHILPTLGKLLTWGHDSARIQWLLNAIKPWLERWNQRRRCRGIIIPLLLGYRPNVVTTSTVVDAQVQL